MDPKPEKNHNRTSENQPDEERQEKLDFFFSVSDVKDHFRETNRESFVEDIEKLSVEVEKLIRAEFTSDKDRDEVFKKLRKKLADQGKKNKSGKLQTINAAITRIKAIKS